MFYNEYRKDYKLLLVFPFCVKTFWFVYQFCFDLFKANKKIKIEYDYANWLQTER